MAIATSYTPRQYSRAKVAQVPAPVIQHNTGAYTLTLNDHGKIMTNFGAGGSVTITAPASPFVGYTVVLLCCAAQAFVFDPKPDTSAIIVKGAIQSAGKTMSVTDEGDYCTVVYDGTNWLAISSISGADADITIES